QGHQGEVDLVDQARGEVLLDGARAAGKDDVFVAGAGPGPGERRLDPVRDERERRAALHDERLARVVGQHEDRGVVWRVLAPPAGPRRIAAPRTRVAAEHVASHDHRAHVGEGRLDDRRAGVDLAALEPVHRPEGGEWERPVVQLHAADTEWVLDALVRAG